MSSDREVQARRRQAIVEILTGDRKVEEQKDLVELLRQQGIPATQSSVSRDLKVLGAVRTRGHYEIPSWTEDDEESVSPFRKVIPFVRSVKPAGPYQTLLVTDPGAGRVVAQAIADSEWEDVVGTVNGDNSVLILTENFFFQRLLFERLKYLLRNEGENEIIEMG
jgi:transcriptional regulator of arginine metabolism